MKISNSLICSSLALMLLLDGACGKKDKKDEVVAAAAAPTTPGVVASDAATVSLSGHLALPLGLTAAERGVLAFRLVGGASSGDPTVVPVDADGNFTFDIDKSLKDIDFINAQFALPKAEWKVDALAAALSNVVGESVENVKGFIEEESEETLKSEFAKILERQKSAGSVNLLVAYDKSPTGDKVAEAASFRFIGLPTASGKSLTALDTQAIKGNLSFGSITAGTGNDASAELTATDALNLSAAAQDTMADAGKALKSIKNSYMNTAWKAGPFYAWRDGNGKTTVVNQFSTPSSYFYDGTGFYVGSQSPTPFVFDEVCGTSAKEVNFTPPSAVDIGNFNDQGVAQGVSSVSKFVNTNRSIGNQGDNRMCLGDTFYAREDATNQFMLNFGRLLNATPEGLWRLNYDGTEIARFELGAASPIDANGKPTVFMPSVKFIKDGSKFTGAVIEFYLWNGSDYVKLTDLSGLKKLFGDSNGSITRLDNNEEMRSEAVFNADSTQMTVSFSEPMEESNAGSFSYYYVIGDSSYRVEFR